MKPLFKITLFAAALLAATQGRAQTPKDETVGHKIGKTATNVGHETAVTAKKVGHGTAVVATKVGHKTAEIAAKGAAAVTDKRYEGKVTRGGETVYINKHAHYYYVNKTGHRVYVNKSELKDKPSD